MELRLIRNATLRLRYGGVNLLIDPMLGTRNSIRALGGVPQRNPTVDLPCTIEEVLADVDAVLVSHVHPDHFDDAAAGVVPRDLPVFCCPGDDSKLTEMGFERVVALSQPTTWNGLQITPTPGSHGSGATGARMGEVIGVVLRADNEPTVYWAGDTILTPAVLETIERERPDVIVTHSGGAVINSSKIIMDASDTIEIAHAAPSATMVAVHFEAIALCPLTRDEMRAAADAARIDATRLLIPVDGETITINTNETRPA